MGRSLKDFGMGEVKLKHKVEVVLDGNKIEGCSAVARFLRDMGGIWWQLVRSISGKY